MADRATGEGNEGLQASFTTAFAPRVLGIRFSGKAKNAYAQFEVDLSHFDRFQGKFRESKVDVFQNDGRVDRVEPPLVTAREFQQALKRYYSERFGATRKPSASGDLPRQVVESLLEGVEVRLDARREDQVRTPKSSDRSAAQKEFQEAERCPHCLLVLGRFHRRRHDFLTGEIPNIPGAVFGFTTGNPKRPVFGELSEDVLGADHVDSWDLFAVADGHHGSRSSELAVGRLLELFKLAFEDGEDLRKAEVLPFLINAFSRCHQAICSDLRNEQSRTSLVAAIRQGQHLFWASVGDSLLFRADADGVVRVNKDLGHGVVGRNQSVWLGDKLFQPKFVDSGSEATSSRCYFLCTDGILAHPQRGARILLNHLATQADPAGAVQRVIQDFALLGEDNTTFVMLRDLGPGR
ncbi:MAG: protein phosphatase 2C domain-containing protein [bacterium]|nr:protein phosphatase 2C domain-containing protein [bacterium]